MAPFSIGKQYQCAEFCTLMIDHGHEGVVQSDQVKSKPPFNALNVGRTAASGMCME